MHVRDCRIEVRSSVLVFAILILLSPTTVTVSRADNLMNDSIGSLQGPLPGARLTFPNHGNVNAFFIFVQHQDEPDIIGSYGSDPVTEWPYDLSLGTERTLPYWAQEHRLVAPPATFPSSFSEGSLSAFYHTMSRGQFTVTGYIYPRVYIPEHPVDWYHENRGEFQNGAVKLSYEILNSHEIQQYFIENPDSLDIESLDTYQNGTNTYVEGGDGVFDLIVIIHRSPTLSRLRRLDKGEPSGGSSITSFGVDTEQRKNFIDYTDPAFNAFSTQPLSIAGMQITDNLTSGSGVIVTAQTRKQAVRIIAHEIGHRQFGFYHTCTSELTANSDCIGVMGGAYLTMSAGDRIKLGWTEVVDIDLSNHQSINLTFPDALHSGKVFRLREGKDECGDVIVEARFWSNFWDAPPNADNPSAPFYGNDDGDSADLFLPDEGLYIYKAPEPKNPRCGGNRRPDYDYALFSSIENSGESTRLIPFKPGRSDELLAFRSGGNYRVAFQPGDIYAHFTLPAFFVHQNESLDRKLSITNITREDGAFRANIWTDYLWAPSERLALHLENFPNPFTDITILQYEIPVESTATLSVYDLLGRRIAVLVEGHHQAGIHRTYFDARDLPSGNYWCKLESDQNVAVAQMSLVK